MTIMKKRYELKWTEKSRNEEKYECVHDKKILDPKWKQPEVGLLLRKTIFISSNNIQDTKVYISGIV